MATSVTVAQIKLGYSLGALTREMERLGLKE